MKTTDQQTKTTRPASSDRAAARRSAYGVILLMLASIIWGSAFVAQSAGMDHVGPFTFQAVRSLFGALSLIPVILISDRLKKNREKNALPTNGGETSPGAGITPTDGETSPGALSPDRPGGNGRACGMRRLLPAGLICGIFLFGASNLQQIGIKYSTVAKSGFITALYIILVPIFGIFVGKKARPHTFICALTAIAGLYLISMTDSFALSPGDLALIGCAILYAIHILLIDRFAPHVDNLRLSFLQMTVAAVLSAIPAIFERPTLAALLAAKWSILYAGVLSSGIAFTLQIIAQKHTPPAISSIAMSLECVFALLSGMLILSEIPTAREFAGAGLMFLSIILAQGLEYVRKKE